MSPPSPSEGRPAPPVTALSPQSRWPGGRELLALGLILAAGGYLRFTRIDLGYFNTHTTRDLYRSLLLLRGVEFPLLGSEMMYGGRVFGPLMYVVCAAALAVKTSPLAVPYLIAGLNTVLIAVIWAFARGPFGVAAALWAAGIFAVFPLEISQTRFYWNPCFLPALVTLALIGVFQVAVRGRPWHLLTAAAAICLGLQLHFSVIELVVSTAIILVVARARIPAKVWPAVIVLVLALFSPLLIHELSGGEGNVAAAFTSEESDRGALERFRFNPNGARNFLYHVALDMNERGTDLGFAHLQTVPLLGDTWIGPRKMTAVRAANVFGKIQLILWIVGVGACIAAIRRHRRDGRALEGEPLESSQRAMVAHAALLIWQAVPVLCLSFFNFHGEPGQTSIVPIRYYLVTYPAPHITAAVGIVALARLAKMRWMVPGLAGALLISHFGFNLMYLQILERSGRFIPYAYPNFAPTMRSMIEVRDILLGEAQIDRDAWYERVHSQHLGNRFYGEATFDWMITQDARSVTNPPPDPHLRWLLHSRMPGSEEPALPPGAEEVRRWPLGRGDQEMTVVEYRVVDASAPVPDNTDMRNIYYPHMRYLGPEADLRERTAP